MPIRLSILGRPSSAAAATLASRMPPVTRHAAAGELAVAMCAFVGRAQPFSLAWLERQSGIPPGRLADCAAGRALPDLAEFLSLCAALPSEFADMVLMASGLGGVRRLACLNGGEGAEPSRLAARAAELVALIGLDLGRGEIPPADAAETESCVRALKARCERWLDHRMTSPFVSPTNPPGGAAAPATARRPASFPRAGRPT